MGWFWWVILGILLFNAIVFGAMVLIWITDEKLAQRRARK